MNLHVDVVVGRCKGDPGLVSHTKAVDFEAFGILKLAHIIASWQFGLACDVDDHLEDFICQLHSISIPGITVKFYHVGGPRGMYRKYPGVGATTNTVGFTSGGGAGFSFPPLSF